MRIAKYLAACGVASRRQSEKLILDGMVSIDGKVITNLATIVQNEQIVRYNNEIVRPFDKRQVWLFHKPKGVLTTRSDPMGRKTIYDVLPENLRNFISIGRLDFNTEGLLLLTNDGEFSRYMELPSSKIPRTYKVRFNGVMTDDMVAEISNGVTVNFFGHSTSAATCSMLLPEASFERSLVNNSDGYSSMKYKECNVVLYPVKDGKNQWAEITLFEGKNREIRNIFEHFGMKVNRLIRIKFGDFALNDLPVCGVKKLL